LKRKLRVGGVICCVVLVALYVAFGRSILGTMVIAGMTSATMIAIFVIPATFYVVEKLSGATKHVRPEAPAPATGD
jgi:hydrophobic/amphiphilic exporter-1 (mainly G- bacteria), HAE1 family